LRYYLLLSQRAAYNLLIFLKNISIHWKFKSENLFSIVCYSASYQLIINQLIHLYRNQHYFFYIESRYVSFFFVLYLFFVSQFSFISLRLSSNVDFLVSCSSCLMMHRCRYEWSIFSFSASSSDQHWDRTGH